MALNIEVGGVISYVNRTRYEHDSGTKPELAQSLELEQAMRDLSGVLAKPEYEGHAETALVHHLGRSAFEDFHSMDHICFSRFVGEKRAADPIGVDQPLLISFPTSRDNKLRDRQTALVVLENGEVTYRSEVEHKRNVEKAGFAGRVAVTTRTLTLLGPTTVVDADLIDWTGISEPIDPYTPVTAGLDGLVLSKRTTIDGRNGNEPTKNNPNDSIHYHEVVFFDGNYVLGWADIAQTIGSNLRAMTKDRHKSSGVMAQALKINQFFDESGYRKDLLDADPNLASALNGFLAAHIALGKLGQKDIDQDLGTD